MIGYIISDLREGLDLTFFFKKKTTVERLILKIPIIYFRLVVVFMVIAADEKSWLHLTFTVQLNFYNICLLGFLHNIDKIRTPIIKLTVMEVCFIFLFFEFNF